MLELLETETVRLRVPVVPNGNPYHGNALRDYFAAIKRNRARARFRAIYGRALARRARLEEYRRACQLAKRVRSVYLPTPGEIALTLVYADARDQQWRGVTVPYDRIPKNPRVEVEKTKHW